MNTDTDTATLAPSQQGKSLLVFTIITLVILAIITAAIVWWRSSRFDAQQAAANVPASPAAIAACHKAVKARSRFASKAIITSTEAVRMPAEHVIDILGMVDLMDGNGVYLPYHYLCRLYPNTAVLIEEPSIIKEDVLSDLVR